MNMENHKAIAAASTAPARTELVAPAPVWGSPEHHEYLRWLGRQGFIYGHMGPGGRDHDTEAAERDGTNYSTTPQQYGG